MLSRRHQCLPLPRLRFWSAAAATLLICLAAAATVSAGEVSASPAVDTSAAASEARHLGRRWADTAGLFGRVLPKSQHLLLGSRSPNGLSCLTAKPIFGLVMDAEGGAATRTAYLIIGSAPQRSSPLTDYEWQQTTFRAYAEELRWKNREVYPIALRLAEETAALARALAETETWPADLKPVEPVTSDHRIGLWLRRLDETVAHHRLPEARRAAAELASAAFALADLHRWLDLLTTNLLGQLDFQARCRHVFAAFDNAFPDGYHPQPHLSGFPGGRAWHTFSVNLVAVEHQAECLFRTAHETPAPPAQDAVDLVPASVWLRPELRPTFVRLRDCLQPGSRAAWDEAAGAPFHHAYLANVLFHVMHNDGEAAVASVLHRYEAIADRVTAEGLMDVVFHRGGDPNGGEVWSDRYHAHLMAAAATLAGTNRQVLLAAQHFTRAAFGGWEHYGKAKTLGLALKEGHFDCINATDMIGALYRNAGRTGFYNILLAGGGGCHAMAAARVDDNGRPAIVAVDGLDTAQLSAARWPDAFFQDGIGWPAGYPRTRYPIRTAELYGRGLETYLWLEGYILRGLHAGHFQVAAVPYLPEHPRPDPEQLRRALVLQAASRAQG